MFNATSNKQVNEYQAPTDAAGGCRALTIEMSSAKHFAFTNISVSLAPHVQPPETADQWERTHFTIKLAFTTASGDPLCQKGARVYGAAAVSAMMPTNSQCKA